MGNCLDKNRRVIRAGDVLRSDQGDTVQVLQDRDQDGQMQVRYLLPGMEPATVPLRILDLTRWRKL